MPRYTVTGQHTIHRHLTEKPRHYSTVKGAVGAGRPEHRWTARITVNA